MSIDASFQGLDLARIPDAFRVGVTPIHSWVFMAASGISQALGRVEASISSGGHTSRRALPTTSFSSI